MSNLPPPSPDQERPSGWLGLPAMRYPNEYVWFVLFSSLDIMLTWAILNRGGTEVNPLAAAVIEHWGLPGAIGFKFSLMLMVVVVCEVAGRRMNRVGLGLAWFAIVVSAMPVAFSLTLLLIHRLR